MKKSARKDIGRFTLWLNKYYWLKPGSTILVAVWLPFAVKYLGNWFHLLKPDGSLKLPALIATFVIYFFAFAIGILSAAESKKFVSYQNEIDTLKNNLALYERIIKSTDSICDKKYDTMIKKVHGFKINKSNVFCKFIEPDVQLKAISKEIEDCFTSITNRENKDLVVSMAYSLPIVCNEWKWVDYTNMYGGFTPTQLMQNQNSAFYQVYSCKDTFIFFNDKLEAVKQNSYILNVRDKKYKNKGSIICMDIPVVTEEGTLARIILSISTYGFKIADDSQEEIMGETIEQIILKRFTKRIRIELINLYMINFLANKKASVQNNAPAIKSIVST